MIALLLLFVSHTVAQYTTAKCASSYNWALNSLNQTPCTVASYLRAACSNESITIEELGDPKEYHYIGPQRPDLADYCWCNSFTYSLMSACGLCQGGDFLITWGDWTTNCSAPLTSNGYWPSIQEFPAGTAVPAWAMESFEKYQVFTEVTAKGIAARNTTEFKKEEPPASSLVPPTSSSISASSSASSSLQPPPTSPVPNNSSDTNVGVIVGGTVGGVLGVVAIGAVVFILSRRNRESNPKKVQEQPNTAQYCNPAPGSTPVSQNTASRLYDPSTFLPEPSTPPGRVSYPGAPPESPSRLHQFQPVRPPSYY